MAVLVRDKKFYKTLIALAVPIALKNLISLSVGLADNVMVGSLGDAALGGTYMANQLMTLLQNIVADVATASAVLSTQYWGKRDGESIKRIVGIGIKLSMALGIVAFVMGFFFTETTLGIYTNEAAVIAEGAKYLKIVSISYLFYCATEMLVASMRCVESVRIGLVLSISTFCVNIGLNWLLIYGNWGFPELGIRGAAIATLTARVIEFLIIAAYVRRIDKKLRIKFVELLKGPGVLWKDFVRYGLPIIAGGVTWGLNQNIQGAIIGHIDSPAAISAMSVANTLVSMITVVVFGVSGGTAIIIGKTVGEGDVERVKLYAKTMQIIFLCLGAVAATMVFFSRQFVGLIWSELDPASIEETKKFLLVLTVTAFGTSYQACSLTGIVRPGGDTKFVFLNDTFWVWCIVLPSAAIAAFVFDAPPVAVFALLKGDQIYKCFVAVVKVNRFKWIKKLTREGEETPAKA